MKLSTSQIKDLYVFTRKHFVEWYDLQTELVDHLANDIEILWKEHPNFSYEEAKEKAFKKFGVFGFMEVVEQRQKSMSKKYRKYLLSELKFWFKLPQIIITIGLFLLFMVLFSLSISNYLLVTFYLIIGIWGLYRGIKLNRALKRRIEISNKKWLLEEIIFKQASGAGGVSFVFGYQTFNIINSSVILYSNTYLIILAAILATLVCIIIYISFEVLPNKAESLLNETYPEFTL